MINLELLFDAIVRFCLISFVLLGTGVYSLRFFKQPIERIRLVQITMLSVLLTTLWCCASFKPTIQLAVLPTAVSSYFNLGSESLATDRVKSESMAGDDAVLAVSTDNSRLANESSFTNRAASAFANDASPQLLETNTTGRRQASSEIINQQNSTAVSPLPGIWSVAKQAIVFVFLLISALLAAQLAFGFVLTKRIVSQAKPLSVDADKLARQTLQEIGAPSNVIIVRSDRIAVPIASGIFQPTILLPEQLASSSDDRLEFKHAIAHEWKHIEQFDLVSWQCVSLCQFALWIQPWYWCLRRDLRISQDQIADKFASDATNEPEAYASTLIRLSKGRQTVLPGALSMTGTKSNLYRRVEMLLDENMGVTGISRKRILIAFSSLMATAGLLLASLQLSHAVAPGPNSTPDLIVVDDSLRTEVQSDESKNEEPPKDSVEHFGYVFDVVTEAPIEGVTVTVGRMKSKTWTPITKTQAQTDAEGKFTFTIPPEQLILDDLYILFDVDHPEYAERHCGSYSYAMLKKNLKFGDRPWFEKLYMVPGAKISGRLVDKDKNPVAGVHLRTSSRDEKFASKGIYGGNVSSISDDEGRFEAVVTQAGIAKLSIIPVAHGLKYVELGDKRGDLGDIVLADGITANGEVRNAKGEPMEGLWVNIKPEETEASYEMLRSVKTDALGKFETRPLTPGSYKVSIQTKATGAIEKKEYANFLDEPTSAMFVEQTIEVTEDSVTKPFVIQAVPHVTLNMQYYTPEGEIRSGHSPSLFGRFDKQRMYIRKGRKVSEGGWEMLVPHGIQDAELRFTTNEHSGLTIQFEGQEASTRMSYRFPRIEEDINNIRIVRYVAPILQVKIVDETGTLIEGPSINALYTKAMKNAAKDEMIEMSFDQIGFEKQTNGIQRSSQVVPGHEFELNVSADGFGEHKQAITMEAGQDELITVTMKKKADSADDDGPGEK